MKTLFIATAALAMSGLAVPAAAQSGTNMSAQSTNTQPMPGSRAVPPGDGITARGHNPEGQPFTPAGFNTGMGQAVYPPAAAAPAGLIGGDYPVCSARVTDRCVQSYTRYTRRGR